MVCRTKKHIMIQVSDRICRVVFSPEIPMIVVHTKIDIYRVIILMAAIRMQGSFRSMVMRMAIIHMAASNLRIAIHIAIIHMGTNKRRTVFHIAITHMRVNSIRTVFHTAANSLRVAIHIVTHMRISIHRMKSITVIRTLVCRRIIIRTVPMRCQLRRIIQN